MSWFERQLVTVLSIILGLLFAAVLIVLSFRYQAAQDARRAEAEAAAAAAAAAAAVEEEPVRSPFLELSYRNGSMALSFALDEQEHWYWVSDDAFPLRQNALSVIIAAARQTQPSQSFPLKVDAAEEGAAEDGAAEDGELGEGGGAEGALQKALSEYGLSDPAAVFHAVTPEGESVSVVMGNALEESEERYALLNGDDHTVCVIPGNLYQAIQTPIYEMYDLPSFPRLTEDVIQSVVIQGAPQESAEDPEDDEEAEREKPRLTTMLTVHHGIRGTSWRAAGTDVSNSRLIRSLLTELSSIQPLQCVDYRPSDEAAAICGFQPAAGQIDVRYTDDSGESRHFNLALGGLTADETGRYIQVGADPTILLVRAGSLSTVMRLAEQGLE